MAEIAVLCSGQGRQDAEMFARLTTYPEAQALLLRLRSAGVLPPVVIDWLDCRSVDPDVLFRNETAQPLLCLYQLMLWEIVRPQLPGVDIWAGYSLGELSAYGVAGILSPEQLISLAAVRGHLMSAATVLPQTMLAVIGLRQTFLEPLCRDCGAYIAIINGPDHFIVGLPLASLAEFRQKCHSAGAGKTVPLPVTVASHTPLQRSAATTFGRLLTEADCRSPSGEILAGVNGERVYDRITMDDTLTRQICGTINWYDCMAALAGYGCLVCLELGPGNSLCRMLQESFPQLEARSLADFHDLRAVGIWLNRILSRQN